MSEDKRAEQVAPEKVEEKPVEPPKKKKTRFHTDPYVKAEF